MIDAWVDAELDPAAARGVSVHVRQCWDCSSAAESARLVKRTLKGRRDREPLVLATARLEELARRLVAP